MIYIFDIDGTLADISHRLPLIQGENKDWDAFFKACPDDQPIYRVIRLLKIIKQDHQIVLISGRSDMVRAETCRWLSRNGVEWDYLLMRKKDDHRQDDVVKAELMDWFFHVTGSTLESVEGVFEDRDQVVKMYREKGLRVYQVADGNF